MHRHWSSILILTTPVYSLNLHPEISLYTLDYLYFYLILLANLVILLCIFIQIIDIDGTLVQHLPMLHSTSHSSDSKTGHLSLFLLAGKSLIHASTFNSTSRILMILFIFNVERIKEYYCSTSNLEGKTLAYILVFKFSCNSRQPITSKEGPTCIILEYCT